MKFIKILLYLEDEKKKKKGKKEIRKGKKVEVSDDSILVQGS
jgi:hypothetical protein